jgi:ankyrin repeat protein
MLRANQNSNMPIVLRDITKAPLLWQAAYTGKLHEVMHLVDHGANILETSSDKKCTALHVAALMGHHQIVDVLVRATYQRYGYVDVDVADINGVTPLQYAVNRLMTKVVELLIGYGANISDPVESIKDPIVWIAVKSLTAAKFPNKGDVFARGYGNAEGAMIKMVQILLDNGAKMPVQKNDHTDCDIWNYAIHGNSSERSIELFKVLLKKQPATVPRYPGGRTIMHEIASLNIALCPTGEDIQMLEILVRHGFDPCKPAVRGDTPVQFAEQRNKSATVQYLLSLTPAESYDHDMDEFADQDDLREGPGFYHP